MLLLLQEEEGEVFPQMSYYLSASPFSFTPKACLVLCLDFRVRLETIVRKYLCRYFVVIRHGSLSFSSFLSPFHVNLIVHLVSPSNNNIQL